MRDRSSFAGRMGSGSVAGGFGARRTFANPSNGATWLAARNEGAGGSPTCFAAAVWQSRAFGNHARLRRTSPIAQHAVAAAIEALGGELPATGNGSGKLGIVLCVMTGCVNYSRRFYDEALNDPATASPLVFPETVFNAPASHIGALLGSTAINYTLVGDAGTFLQGLVLAADWLSHKQVDGCLVIGAEELDWLTTEGFWMFDEQTIVSDGAGALYLRADATETAAVRLEAVTDPYVFSKSRNRLRAAQAARSELENGEDKGLLCDGLQGTQRMDRDEELAWSSWAGPRLSPKRILGEASVAGAAWQCIAAVDAVQRGVNAAATVSVVGSNQQAIAARFVRMNSSLS
jgi:hypothetical protein